jgi:hypothetical protein
MLKKSFDVNNEAKVKTLHSKQKVYQNKKQNLSRHAAHLVP